MTDPDHIMPPIRPEEGASLRDRATSPSDLSPFGSSQSGIPSANDREAWPDAGYAQALRDLSGNFGDEPIAGVLRDAADTIDERSKLAEERGRKYQELIYAVGTVYPGETRHETALKYIRRAEVTDGGPAQAIEARSDETRSGSAVGESAVTEGHAPNHIMPPIHNPGPLETEEGIRAAFEHRLSVYRTKQKQADPFAEASYNRHETLQHTIEGVELLAEEAGIKLGVGE